MLSQTNSETLESYFPDWLTTGAIFTHMENMPWSEYATPLELDLLYIGSHSGEKPVASMVKKFSTNHVADGNTLASLLKTMYYKSWEHIWNAYAEEYSPLSELDITETENRSLEGEHSLTKSGTMQKTAGDTLTLNTTTQNNNTSTTQNSRTENADSDNTSTVTDNTQTQTTSTENTTQEGQNNDFVYGFNTDEENPTPSAKSTNTSESETQTSETISNTGTTTTTEESNSSLSIDDESQTEVTDTETRTGTETHAITDNVSDSTSETMSRGEDELITRRKTGNSGYHTYSEIIASEFEVWRFNYFQYIFNDIDKILTLSVFS